MVDMWANFATYGKPIPSPDEMLEGGKKKLESLVSLKKDAISFEWNPTEVKFVQK